MTTITYMLNDETHWFDVSTLQEANQKVKEIESKYNIPGNNFCWTHSISEQTRGLVDEGKILLNEGEE